MPPSACTILPRRFSDPVLAVAACRADGAAIFCVEPASIATAAGAAALPASLFGELLHAAAQPMQIRNALFPDPGGGVIREVTYKPLPGTPEVSGPAQGGGCAGTTNESTRDAHTDSMGKRMPDFIMLACAGAARSGGENFIIDLHGLIDSFGEAPETAWLVEALSTHDVVSINSNTTSRATDLWLGPIAPVAAPDGVTSRRIAQGRETYGLPSSTDPGSAGAQRDAEMVRLYNKAYKVAQAAAPRKFFRLILQAANHFACLL